MNIREHRRREEDEAHTEALFDVVGAISFSLFILLLVIAVMAQLIGLMVGRG